MMPENPSMAEATHCAMGTVMTHKAFGVHAEDCLRGVCAEVAHIEALLSRFLPGSDIRRVNGWAGIRSERVSADTYHALAQAVEFCQDYPGCFDVTIEPLVTLWQAGQQASTAPDAASIERVLPLVNYRDLMLDPWDGSAGLVHAGQSLDLGGIGKGVAGDRIVEIYRAHGISSAYSNLGGNVVTVGNRPDGRPWQIGIQHPRQARGLIGAVSVTDETVVTSGDYQRFFTDGQGKRHHHILDPATGYPAQSGLTSVTIVTSESSIADPLSTIVFVAGMEKGLGYVRSLPDTEAVLVDSHLNVYVTRGLKGRLQPANGNRVTFVD